MFLWMKSYACLLNYSHSSVGKDCQSTEAGLTVVAESSMAPEVKIASVICKKFSSVIIVVMMPAATCKCSEESKKC